MNEGYFDNIDSEEKAYWLGYIVADGHLLSNMKSLFIEISITDERHLLKFASIFNVPMKHRYRKLKGSDREYGMCSFYINSPELCLPLWSYGLNNKKSVSLDSSIFEYIPDNLFHHFVRGFFDGDGTINKKRVMFYGNLEFLSALGKKLKDFTDLEFNISKNRTIYSLYICSLHSCFIFKEWLYNGSTLFLERKYEKFPQNAPKLTSKYRHIHYSQNKWIVTKEKEGKKIINKSFRTENDAVQFALSQGLDINRNNIYK